MVNVAEFINMYPGYASANIIHILEALEHQVDSNPHFYLEQFFKDNGIVASTYVVEFCRRFLEYYMGGGDLFLEPIENYQFGNGIQKSPITGKWRWWKLMEEPYTLSPDFELAKVGRVREVTSADAFIELQGGDKIPQMLQQYPFIKEDFREFTEGVGRCIRSVKQENVTTIWVCPSCNMPNQSSLRALKSDQLKCYNCGQLVMLT